MANCIHCGASMPDGLALCPYCGRLQQENASPVSGVSPFAQGGYDTYMQQQAAQAKKDLSTAKTLGIVSIVCVIITSFWIIGVVSGIIGLMKANAAMRFAQQTADFKMYEDAKTARMLSIVGLSIAGAVVLIVIALLSLFAAGIAVLN